MGGGKNSVRKALEKNKKKYQIFTFDIVEESENFKNLVVDLSQNNIVEVFQNLIKQKKIKKPDIIVSSPLCQTFSSAMQSISNLPDKKGKFFSGNPYRYWDYEKKLVKNWPENKQIKWNGFCGNSYPQGYLQVPISVAELGNRCIENVIQLINFFKPKTWYIENPAKSLIWKYIKYNLKFEFGYKNIAHYSAYNNNFSKKPTCFLSNVEMKLKKIKKGQMSIKKINEKEYQLILSGACKNNSKDELKRQRTEMKLREKLGRDVSVKLFYQKNAMARSKIPSELIVDIFNFFEKSETIQETLDFKYTNIKLTSWSNKDFPSIEKMIEMKSI